MHPFTQSPRHGPHFHAMGPGRGRHGRHGGFRGWDGPRGNRARRGDVRTAILVLLAEEPRNGYQLMQEIEERSDGVWRPSPGSIYPALQQLEEEGLIVSEESGRRRRYSLTEEGRAAVAERGDDPAPWDAMSDAVDSDTFKLFGA